METRLGLNKPQVVFLTLRFWTADFQMAPGVHALSITGPRLSRVARHTGHRANSILAIIINFSSR